MIKIQFLISAEWGNKKLSSDVLKNLCIFEAEKLCISKQDTGRTGGAGGELLQLHPAESRRQNLFAYQLSSHIFIPRVRMIQRQNGNGIHLVSVFLLRA